MPTLKKVIAVLLIASTILSCFTQLLVFTGYKLNKNYIAAVLCTNKSNPELHCNGKCFLDIKIKELEKKYKQEQETLKRSSEVKPPVFNFPLAIIQPLVMVKTETLYLQKQPQEVYFSIFHPPALG